MISSLSAFYPEANTAETLDLAIMYLLAKAKTLAAYSYKKRARAIMYPLAELSYAANFLRMMFGIPRNPTRCRRSSARSTSCSSSTPTMSRTAARPPCAWSSSQANLFARFRRRAPSGPAHGGANRP